MHMQQQLTPSSSSTAPHSFSQKRRIADLSLSSSLSNPHPPELTTLFPLPHINYTHSIPTHMPIQIARSFTALVIVAVLQCFVIGLVESRPEYALRQYYGRSVDTLPYMRQQQPLYVEVAVDMPAGVSRDAYLYRSALVQFMGGTSIEYGPITSSGLGRLQALLVESRCLGLEQWIWRARTQDIKMGRSYRRLLVGRPLQEELQALWFKCHPHINAYDDDIKNGAAGLERNTNIALMELSTYRSLQSTGDYMVEGNILQAFLLSHPSFFLHLALAFLLIAFLASLLYFSLD